MNNDMASFIEEKRFVYTAVTGWCAGVGGRNLRGFAYPVGVVKPEHLTRYILKMGSKHVASWRWRGNRVYRLFADRVYDMGWRCDIYLVADSSILVYKRLGSSSAFDCLRHDACLQRPLPGSYWYDIFCV